MDLAKSLLKKYWPLITWLISFVLDTNFQIIESMGFNAFQANIIRGLGALVLAFFTEKGLLKKLKYNPNQNNT